MKLLILFSIFAYAQSVNTVPGKPSYLPVKDFSNPILRVPFNVTIAESSYTLTLTSKSLLAVKTAHAIWYGNNCHTIESDLKVDQKLGTGNSKITITVFRKKKISAPFNCDYIELPWKRVVGVADIFIEGKPKEFNVRIPFSLNPETDNQILIFTKQFESYKFDDDFKFRVKTELLDPTTASLQLLTQSFPYVPIDRVANEYDDLTVAAYREFYDKGRVTWGEPSSWFNLFDAAANVGNDKLQVYIVSRLIQSAISTNQRIERVDEMYSKCSTIGKFLRKVNKALPYDFLFSDRPAAGHV